MTSMNLPSTQTAVQLTSAKQLRLNKEKAVPAPGPRQYLVKVEAVGLCFSDMKLLAQFSSHVRKGEVLSGAAAGALESLPSYAPGEKPTVPGHEVCCQVVAVGKDVAHYGVGQRFIVQADYRPLRTASSNGAFGYNFEGGLQEFVLLDERITGDPGDPASFMIPVPQGPSASQLALVEPWACVENSYASQEGAELDLSQRILLVTFGGSTLGEELPVPSISFEDLDAKDESVDILILVAPTAEGVESCQRLLAKNSRMVILQCGHKMGRKVKVDVGRIHYMGHRIIGTPGDSLLDAFAMAPPDGGLGDSDRVLVVGAGGPMGQMHVIRALASSQGEVVATDTSAERLEGLARKLGSWQGRCRTCLASELASEESFDCVALMAPVPSLIQDAIERSRAGAKINIFAGIPVGTLAELDLDRTLDKGIYLFGTSGSEPQDMRVVLRQTLDGLLDTNLSVAAVSGMAGAIEGLRAVEERTLDGKIVVYPALKEMPLIPLDQLDRWYPSVASCLAAGQWTAAAEKELLRVAQ